VVVQNDDDKSEEPKGHEATVRCLRWNPREGSTHLLATGSDDKTTIVWDSTVKEGTSGDIVNHFK
jgi:WD40 repeat protein